MIDHDALGLPGSPGVEETDPKPHGPVMEDFGAAALLAQPFMIFFMIMRFRYPPTNASWARADPILKLLPREAMMWLTPLFGVALTVVLLVLAWPSWKILGRALIWGVVGAVIAGAGMAITWKLHGSHLPRLLALEESAGAGFTFGPMAGYLEEIMIRVGVLPLVFLHMSGRSRVVAAILASLITSLVFAVMHEPGSDAAFSPIMFAIRFAIPGLVLCLTAIFLKPSFAVAANGTVHLIVPFLFY